MRFLCTVMVINLMLSFAAMAGWAERAKFQIDGTTLIYDTQSPGEGESDEIDSDDVERLLDYLRSHDEITTLQVNSNGGDVWAATRMKDIIIDFGLDTHVHGVCESSCVTLFLGGDKRTMSRGSVMGFHQIYWSAASIERYYERHRDRESWDTPFEFAEWMYLDTQDEIFDQLSFMLSRGVDAEFAIRSIRNPGSSMWRPYRFVLLGAGVLTD